MEQHEVERHILNDINLIVAEVTLALIRISALLEQHWFPVGYLWPE